MIRTPISFSAAQGNSGLSSSNHAIMLGSEGKKALMYILFYGVRLFIVVLTSWKAFAAKGLRLFEGLDDSACFVPVSTKTFVATSSFISGRLFFSCRGSSYSA
jgi:hypothetical protein